MKRFLLSIALIALVPGLAHTAFAAGSGKQAAVAGQKAATSNPADYVGSDVCATCHADVATKFARNPHRKINELHGSGSACESCHGPGKAHDESGGDVSKILQISKASPKQVDATCLGCHAGAHPNYERSPHAKAGVGCTSCHSVHAGDTDAKLLKAPQPQLCFQCHADVKPSFNMPFHHRVNEGLVKCSDCHDVHGTFQANNLKITADQNAVCTKCHSETRGPFVYEHAPVKAEWCMACHTPHGSQNARLLNVPNVNQLCNQCHSNVSADNVHGMGKGSQELAPCTSCHTYIHGSNINAAFLR